MQLLLKTNAYFSRFYCIKTSPTFVFSSFRTSAGLRPKKCWVRGGRGLGDFYGLDVCECGTRVGKIFQTRAGTGRV